ASARLKMRCLAGSSRRCGARGVCGGGDGSSPSVGWSLSIAHVDIAPSFREVHMPTPQPKQAVKDPSHLYTLDPPARHSQRPGFRITQLQLSPTQTVPWHTHTNVSDTFYVLEGTMRLFLQNPKEKVELVASQIYQVAPGRPHLVTNAGSGSMTFLVLQGVGDY